MTGKLLLDTTAVVDLLHDHPTVQRLVADIREIYLPAIVLGELYYGARKSNRVQERLAETDVFASGMVVLPCTTETARHYGQIKYALRVRGRPIPENDIWIAAVALQHGLTLVTSDIHYREVEGLPLLTW